MNAYEQKIEAKKERYLNRAEQVKNENCDHKKAVYIFVSMKYCRCSACNAVITKKELKKIINSI